MIQFVILFLCLKDKQICVPRPLRKIIYTYTDVYFYIKQTHIPIGLLYSKITIKYGKFEAYDSYNTFTKIMIDKFNEKFNLENNSRIENVTLYQLKYVLKHDNLSLFKKLGQASVNKQIKNIRRIYRFPRIARYVVDNYTDVLPIFKIVAGCKDRFRGLNNQVAIYAVVYGYKIKHPTITTYIQYNYPIIKTDEIVYLSPSTLLSTFKNININKLGICGYTKYVDVYEYLSRYTTIKIKPNDIINKYNLRFIDLNFKRLGANFDSWKYLLGQLHKAGCYIFD